MLYTFTTISSSTSKSAVRDERTNKCLLLSDELVFALRGEAANLHRLIALFLLYVSAVALNLVLDVFGLAGYLLQSSME